MIDQKHTPEPWSLKDGFWSGSIFYKEQCIGSCCEHKSEANARRIVACVNACAGIPTDDLELCPHGGMFHLAAHANQLVEQRDKLLAALGALTDAAGQWTCHSEELRLTHFQARVVMNSVKGGAA